MKIKQSDIKKVNKNAKLKTDKRNSSIEIKYLDNKARKQINKNAKLHKPENAFMISLMTVSLMICLLSFPVGMYHDKQKNKIYEKTYITENNEEYDLSDIYLLFNDHEVIQCIRIRKEIDSKTQLTFHPFSVVFPKWRTETRCTHIYEFYDINTNQLIAYTKYDSEKQSNDYYFEESMNGYDYINLGRLVLNNVRDDTNIDDYEDVTKEYIDQIIENCNTRSKK